MEQQTHVFGASQSALDCHEMVSIPPIWVLAVLVATVLMVRLLHCRKAASSNATVQEGSLGVLEMDSRCTGSCKNRQATSNTVIDILKSDVLFHAMDTKVVASYARRFDMLELSKGSSLDVANSYAMAFIVRGSVGVFLDELEHNSKGTTTVDVRLPNRRLFRSVAVGQPLVPSLQTLSELVAGCVDDKETGPDALGHTESLHLTFVAAEDTELAVLDRTAFREGMDTQPGTLLHFIDAVLRRLYFSTLPIAHKYLGLGQEIAAFGEQLLAKTAIASDHQTILRKQVDQLERSKFLSMFEPFSLQALMHSQTSPDVNLPSLMKRRQQEFMSSTRPSSNETSPSDLRVHIPETGPAEQLLSPPTSSLASALSRVEGIDFSMASILEYELSSSSLSQTVRCKVTSFLLHRLGLLSGSTSPDIVDKSSDTYQDGTHLHLGKLVFVTQGTKLISQGKRYPAVFLLIDGQLQANIRSRRFESDSPEVENRAFPIKSGEILGYDSLLPHNRSLFDVVAVTDAYLTIIPRSEIHRMLNENPSASISLANNVLRCVSQLLRLVDFSLTWRPYEANEVLKYDPTPSHSVVLNGQLRITDYLENGREQVSHEVGAGESFGIMNQYPQGRASRQVRAVRKTQVTQMQVLSFEGLAYRFPPLAFRFMNAILGNPTAVPIATIEGPKGHTQNANVQTVAIISLGAELDAEKWSRNLKSAIESLGISENRETTTISLRSLQRSLARTRGPKIDEALLENYVAQVEDSATVVLYAANLAEECSWAQTCIEHADIVLFLASASYNPHLSSEESRLLEQGIAARTMLILVEKEMRQNSPGIAARWLKNRPWISDGIHHILLPCTKSVLGSELIDLSATTSSDFQRLARRVFSRSIALVLGGGGARGISHLVVLKALEERNIPVDVIGGCSIGSFIGGVYAKEVSFSTTYNIVRDLCVELHPWRFFLDFTYPWLSMTTGARFNRLIKNTFPPAMDLVDTRLEFYCAVTNLTKHGATQFLTEGSAWKSIRASMSFLGFVPPMTDCNGDMLFDGCYSSNLPVAHAAEHVKPDLILAVDIGPDMDLPKYSWGEEYSAWKVMYRRFNPYQRNDLPRPYSWIADWLTYSRSLADIEVTKAKMHGCEYTKTPLGNYGVLDFAKFDEVYRIGYEHATKWLDDLEAKGVFERLALQR